MKEFSEIENDLKKLRPRQPSSELIRRVEEALENEFAERKIVRPAAFRFNWVAATVGLAAAAVLLIFARLEWEQRGSGQRVAQASPSPSSNPMSDASGAASSSIPSAQFIPSGATEVVYAQHDDGLVFPHSSNQPVRRIRSHKRETLRWHNPATGATLQVTYPTEQVELVPVSGQ